MPKLSQLFPTYGIRNLKIYYLIAIFTNGWFFAANWVFYWLKFMSKTEMGIVDALLFLFGILLEIPSGAICDLLGKKKTLIFAYALISFGLGLAAFGGTFAVVVTGAFILFAGFAFQSGALEAFAYDSMVEYKKEEFYPKVASKFNVLSLIITIVTTLVGGYLFSFDIRLPWIASFVFFSFSLLIIFFAVEPRVDTLKFSWENYVKQLKVGFVELSLPVLKKYTLIFFVLIGIYRLWGEGYIRMLMGEKFGFNGETFSYVYAFVLFMVTLVIYRFDLIRSKIGDNRGPIILLIMLALGFGTAALTSNWVIGFGITLVLALSGRLADVWASVIVNKNIDSRYRATTLSTLQLVTKIPYVIISLFAGYLAEQGLLDGFYLGVAGLLILFIFFIFVGRVKMRG